MTAINGLRRPDGYHQARRKRAHVTSSSGNTTGRVVVIMPTYNERGNICELIEAIGDVLRPLEAAVEVIVVDDDSPDGTAAAVREKYPEGGEVKLFVRTGDRAGLTGKVILDKLVDLSMVGIFAGLGLLLTKEPAARSIGAAVFAGVLFAWMGTLLLLPRLEALVAGVDHGWLARFRIPAVVSGLAGTPRSQLALNMALSLVGFIIFYSQAFVLMRAFWAEASWTVVPYFPIITLSTILPVAVGGVGIREWTAILLLRQFGVTDSVAFNTFFAHFVVVQLLPAFAGAAIAGSFRREGW